MCSPSSRTLLNLLELGITRTHQPFTPSSPQGLLCRAVLLLLVSLLPSAPHSPSSACLERVVFTMPCPSYGLCWWDLLLLGEQNFPYKPLRVWGTPMCSGGALLPPRWPKSTARASGCSGPCPGALLGTGLDGAPGGTCRGLACASIDGVMTAHCTVGGITRSPGTAGPWTPQQPSVPPSCHRWPFLWPLVTCL